MTPRVSVVMACFNAARHLPEAVASVLAQDAGPLELILADDGSTDASVDLLPALARGEPRLKVLPASRNGGPGAARNRALDVARGEWVAIVDADDVILPHRLRRLLDAAGTAGADAAADDLVFFGDPASEGRRLLEADARTEPWPLDAETFARAHLRHYGLPMLGYLKPVLRRAALRGLRYDETMRIGEDSDFLLRFLAGGARMVVVPEALYRYRRHPASVSHRWSAAAIGDMIAGARRAMAAIPTGSGELHALMEERCAAMGETLAYETMIDDLRRGDLGAAAAAALRRPTLLSRLAVSAREGLARRTAARVWGRRG